ncbi:DEAD/DEAH box helicase [Candidatus Contubernalis alkaliaceticus]|uniref:DEAD/DEAH box helicase n=1 Tax=Candidatus Contubernalis alkaliaceticus TaxID=338645 RepID=UPI001F4C0118|nr:helicase-related protein [Candidatus Contubernalis alkalaceticus]UNC91279.1 hypothetical protein HUE98_03760 [Candidatus Contubernalis alkalaceticus]
MNHFEPSFLLGLTATPYRMDNQDLFSLCDDNIIYEISLKQAIERDLLVPFRYNAMYDPTDYDKVKTSNGRFVVEDLEKHLSYKERADLILTQYHKLAGKRTLGFCVSISHAEYMAEYFCNNGVSSAAVHSGPPGNAQTMDRKSALEAMGKGDLDIIFAVDIFNEGVDIPSLDTVMFLRPTESYVIFLQQLGRGLRKYQEKNHLTVIDFIGNYKRANYIPLLLAGENPWTAESSSFSRLEDYEFPEGCVVSFDFRVIDLFVQLAARDPLPVRMRETYYRIKNELGRRPGRFDMFEGSDIPLREYLKEGWLRFLESAGDLTEIEMEWLDTPAEDFLLEIEQTRFTKAYKVPTIKAFIKNETIVSKVDLNEIGKEMMHFYRDYPLHQKDLNNKAHRKWQSWEEKQFSKLAKNNPVKFLSRGRFFNFNEIKQQMYLDPSIEPNLSPELADHVKDILKYRKKYFFQRRYKED